MRILEYSELDQWIRDKITEANVFFQEEYVSYISKLGEEILFVSDEERIVPVRHRKKAIFNFVVLVSEPYGLVEEPTESLGDFLDKAVDKLVRECGIQWITTTAAGFFADTVSHDCKRIPFGSHVADLTLSVDDLWGRVHSKHRNVIRAAENKGINVKRGALDLIPDYILMERDTSRRTGRHVNGVEYYSRQIGLMPNNTFVYIAYKGDIPQAGGIFYYNRARCYYMYGAMAQNAVNGSANLLLWKVMLDMKSAGVKEFSFVGCRINEDPDSKYHGIQRFKERFGGELRRGYLFRYERTPFMYRLFCRAMQVKMHLARPYTDPIDEEIHKWTDIQV